MATITEPPPVVAMVECTTSLPQLPPTPPETVIDGEENKSVKSIEEAGLESPAAASSSPSTLDDIPLPPPTSVPAHVLDIDRPTPDAHVPRDPRLIRLTGVHPFNCEAPLTDLFDEGFLTSPELFYVRNHGGVPAVKEDEALEWEISVEGCVPSSTSLFI